MQKKNILLITAFFYPQNVIAVSRVGQWTKYWAKEGHRVTVLTTKKYPLWPLGYNQELPDNVRIIEVAYIPAWLEKKLFTTNINNIVKSENSGKFDFLKYQFRKIKKYLGSLLDIHDLWVRPALKVGKKLVENENFDLIVSSYSPAASHIIAGKLKSLQPDSIWIADFRDLWTDNHVGAAKGLFGDYERYKEKKTLGTANILTTVSQPLAEILTNKYSNKHVSVIANGFDPEENVGWEQRLEKQKKITNAINICYTGKIYAGLRDPTPLFIAINELIEENKINKNQIAVHFYGNSRNELEDIIAHSNANRYQFIFIHDSVSRDASLAVQKNSDLLLLLEWNDPSAHGVLTGKLFEYLISGNPVLAVGLGAEASITKLLQESGAGISVLDSFEIKKIILNAFSEQTFSFYKPNKSIIDLYARDKQAKNILSLSDHEI